jgi:hypothetical protein
MVYTPNRRETMPIPAEPAVICVHLKAPASEGNMPIYVPWKHCQLSFAYTVTTVAEGNDAAVEIDLELNTAGGTEMMSITVAQNAAIGDIDEATVSNQAACEDLSSDDTARDAVNVEYSGTNTTGQWEGMLFMYFEAWEGE